MAENIRRTNKQFSKRSTHFKCKAHQRMGFNLSGLSVSQRLVFKSFIKIWAKSTTYPLVSKHRLNNVLMYEVEDQWKIGLEAYYFSKQKLNDVAMGKSYWTTGFMAEKVMGTLLDFYKL